MVDRRTVTARTTRFAMAGLAIAGLIAACSGRGDDDDTGATAATTTSTIVDPPASDGVLTIGVMRPPASSLLRESISLATEQAVSRINEAGGSFGGDVRLVPVDEGETVSSARDAIEDLIEQNVDAVVGPMSSVIALATLETITSAGMLACSPTATALALDDFPDDGMFIRTVPSDSMQAAAIVQVAERDGRAVGHHRVRRRRVRTPPLRRGEPMVWRRCRSTSTTASGSRAATPNWATRCDRVLDTAAGVVILLADSTDGTQFLEALSDELSNQISTIIVNDALRAPESSQRLAGLRSSIRQKIRRRRPAGRGRRRPVRSAGAVRHERVRLRDAHRARRGIHAVRCGDRHRTGDRGGQQRRLGVPHLRRLRRRTPRLPRDRLQRPVGR